MAVELTPEEISDTEAALRDIQRARPTAANAIRRLLRAATRPAGGASRYVTVSQVAEFFEVTPQTVRNWVDRGWLPADRIGRGPRKISVTVLDRAKTFRAAPRGRRLLDDDELQALIEARRRRSAK